ncbi:MAG: aromatic aminobenezylarsenical efflux permease ArsG family transporter [Bacteroidales bacterium]
MEWLQMMLENSSMPVVTAFLLGLLTAVSPCPLATNITAVGYIGKDIESRHRVFVNGLLYTLGRIIGYSVLGAVLITLLREGTGIYAVQKAISRYGEMLIAPVLILIGVYLLDVIRLNLPSFGTGNGAMAFARKGGWGALLLGILFALAFCPSSGIFFFGMLMPLSAAESGGYWLPVVFAVATALPVMIVAWILAYSMAGLGRFYNRMQVFEKWFRRIAGILFIITGIYYGYVFYF